MYTDVVVLAGVGTVLLAIAFMGGFAYMFVQDGKKHDRLEQNKK